MECTISFCVLTNTPQLFPLRIEWNGKEPLPAQLGQNLTDLGVLNESKGKGHTVFLDEFENSIVEISRNRDPMKTPRRS